MINLEDLKQSLTTQAEHLEITMDAAGLNRPVSENQMVAFKAKKAELIAFASTFKINTPEDFALAGEIVGVCEAAVAAVDSRIDPPKRILNDQRNALLADRKDLALDVETLAETWRKNRAAFKAEQDRLARLEAERIRIAAEAEAKRVRDEQARLAREAADRIAEEARLAAEAAAEEARVERERVAAEAEAAAAAAAEIEDPMEALAAQQAAEEAAQAAEAALAAAAAAAAEDQAERAREAERAQALAEQAAAAPVVVARVEVVTMAKEDGVSWADNWQPEYESEEALLRTLVAAGRLEFLSVNMKAVNATVKAQKSLCNIPGVKAVNNKIERRSQK